MVDTTAASAPQRMSHMEVPEQPGSFVRPVATELLSWGGCRAGQLGIGTSRGERHTPGPVLVPEATTFTGVSAGPYHALALTSGGQVLSWGGNDFGELGVGPVGGRDRPGPVPLPGDVTAIAVRVGIEYSVALGSDFEVYTWGDNYWGQLGLGDVHNRDVPVRVTVPWSKLGLPEDTTITAIAAGYGHTLALTSTKQVLAWGGNGHGELGNGDNTGKSCLTPVLVQLGEVKVKAIAAGYRHSLAITTTGQALAWGSNAYGELGDPRVSVGSSVPVPVQLPKDVSVTAVAAGYRMSLARTDDGGLLAWGVTQLSETLLRGTNLSQPGADNSVTEVPTPVPLPQGVTVTDSISTAPGPSHCLVATSDYRVLGWGSDAWGELGDGNSGPFMSQGVPVWSKLPPGVKVHAVSAAAGYSLALASPGPKLAWGANDLGQLGNNEDTPADQHTPVVIGTEDMVFTDLAAGDSHSLAISDTGHVLAWGSNTSGQLGLGEDPLGLGIAPPPYIDKPTEVVLPEHVIPQAVAGGAAHSLALNIDGALYVWGRNNYGQLGLGENASRGDHPIPVEQPLDWLPTGARIIAIAAAYLQSLVLLNTGQVYAFGFNFYGQLGTGDTKPCFTPAPMQLPAGVSVTGIAAGSTYSLILASDGIAYGCGYNYFGQLGTGDNHQLLKPDKTKPVVVPEGVTGIATITAAGAGSHSLAITTDGKALAFGANRNGQLGYGQPGTNSKTAEYVDTRALNLPTGTTIAAIAAGGAHSLAITNSGLILAWGANTHGQLGNNYPTQANRPQPVSPSLAANASGVAAGQYHSLAR